MPGRRIAGFISAFYNPLQVPNAPTIDTTSTVSNTSLSVTFTAPSNVGGGAITGYIATAKRTSDGATISATGSSSPITITGLTAVPFTVTVVAVNSFGPSASSVASNSVTPANLVIGQVFNGGYYAGQISTAGNGVADYYLIVAPASSGQSSKQFKTTNSTTSGTKSLIDGPTNSSNMNNASHPAAQFCEGLSIGGYSDWYMPAKNELEVCYYNLKPTTTTNDTSTGTNANSVPSRGNYSSGTPAQTSATDFQVTGTERFLTSTYWSSTEYISVGDYAWKQSFSNGIQQYDTKNGTEYVRAVRRVPV